MLRLWEVATGKKIRTLREPPSDVLSVAFSPDGKTMASAGDSSTVRLWEVASGKEIRTLQGHRRGSPVHSVAFSPNGKTVISGGHDSMVRLWEVATGKPIRILRGNQEEKIWSVAFAPDGRTVAAASGNQVRLWDIPTGEQLPPLVGHRGNVYGVAFSPDCRTLASVSDDSTGLVWDVTYGVAHPTAKPDQDMLRALWTDLASPDTARARRAICVLAAIPAQSVSLIRDRLRPVPAEMGKRLTQLVADLNSDEFKVRQKAYRELEEHGPDAAPFLRKALRGNPSPDLLKRLVQFQEALEAGDKRRFSGGFLRGLRAVEVLERAGTPQAREVLKTLAAGAPEFRLTQEAEASLARLAKRPGARP